MPAFGRIEGVAAFRVRGQALAHRTGTPRRTEGRHRGPDSSDSAYGSCGGLPGDLVTLQGLVVDPDGDPLGAIDWAVCMRPRTASELGGVSDDCAHGASLQVVANPVAMPQDTCARFGPNPPPVEGDGPQQRPADPDRSGGYYLPFRADGSDLATLGFGFARVRCELPGVTRAIFEEFESSYTLNANPRIAGFGPSEQLTLGATRPMVASVNRDEALALGVAMAPGSAGDYVVYVAGEAALEPRRETLFARWYVTAGELNLGQVMVRGDRASVNWTLPSVPGPVSAWVVVTDDRGGVGWMSVQIEVR